MGGVLLQIDPTQALAVADKLASGSERTILAILCVALAAALGWAIWRLIAEIKACGERYAGVIERKIETDGKLADAIRGSNEVNRAALDALRSAKA